MFTCAFHSLISIFLVNLLSWQQLWIMPVCILNSVFVYILFCSALLMCSCCTVNVIFTVTNSVLFPLHTLSLLLICLLCICKYVSIFYFSFSVFFCFLNLFSSRSRGFLQTTDFTLKWPHFLPAAALKSPPLYLTSIPPLPSSHTHTLSDVYSFLTSRPSLMRSDHANKQWKRCRFFKDAACPECMRIILNFNNVPHTSWKVRTSVWFLEEARLMTCQSFNWRDVADSKKENDTKTPPIWVHLVCIHICFQAENLYLHFSHWELLTFWVWVEQSVQIMTSERQDEDSLPVFPLCNYSAAVGKMSILKILF